MRRRRPLKPSTRRGWALVGLVMVGLLLAGCGPGYQKTEASSFHNGTPTTSHPSPPVNHANALDWFNNVGEVWPQTLDPTAVSSVIDVSDVQMMNANLVKLDHPSLKVIPDLATWAVSPNHKTYTFHLRANARFSNGDPVTAQDAAWSITRALLPATRSPVASTYLGHILGATALNSGTVKTLAGLKVLDTHTLRITLDQPIAFFLPALSYPTADVLDPRVMQGQAPQSYLTNTCSGNQGAGPFKLVCQNNGSGQGSFYPSGQSPFLHFTPNPFYYGSKPTIDVYSPFFANADTAYQAFQTGELDGISVPPQYLGNARGLQGFISAPLLQTDTLSPNMQAPPFDNLHCRLAVAYAINRTGITEKILQGAEGPLYAVVPPGLLSYFGRRPNLPHFDPARAKEELKQCPGRLQNVSITYAASSVNVTYEFLAILSNLTSIGANVQLNQVTFNKWLVYFQQSQVNSGQNLMQYDWIADYPDPQDWLGNLLSATALFNIAGFKNARYNQLVDEGNVTFDPTKRARLYEQAQEIALSQGAWLPIGYAVGNYVINPNVHGMVPDPQGVYPLHADWSQVSVTG